MGESKFDPAPHLAELIDGVKELAARGGDQRYLAQLLTGPYAALRGGLLLDEPGREGTSTANAIREAMTGYKPTEIGFVIWDPNTDGVAILHDGKLAWQESTFDRLSQYLRDNELVGTGRAVVLEIIDAEEPS